MITQRDKNIKGNSIIKIYLLHLERLIDRKNIIYYQFSPNGKKGYRILYRFKNTINCLFQFYTIDLFVDFSNLIVKLCMGIFFLFLLGNKMKNYTVLSFTLFWLFIRVVAGILTPTELWHFSLMLFDWAVSSKI